VLDIGVNNDLRRIAGDARCTVDQLLLAAFHALLFRYTEATPIVVGWQIEDTPLAVWPVRASPSADLTLLDLIADVRSACEQSSVVGLLSLDLLSAVAGEDGERRDQVALPLRFSASGNAFPPDSPLAVELSLSVTEKRDGGIDVTLVGNAHLYSAPFIETMAHHYRRLVEGVAEHPGTALAEFDLATPEENALLCGWAAGPDVPREPELCHVQFEQRVAANPCKPAVVFPGGALTYAELDLRANQIAHFLRSLGVGPETPVALSFRRSPQLVMTYLGAVKAGGAVFLLDPGTPSERRQATLRVIRPLVVLTHDQFDHRASGEEWPAVCFREIAAQLDRQDTDPPYNSVVLGNTLSLLATSGSTGVPKIVRQPIGHRRAATGYESENVADPPSDDRHLLKTDSGTGFTHAEITRPLLTGGTLFIAPEGVEYDASALAAYIDEHRISCLLTTPSQLSALLHVEDLSRCDSLRVIDCIGEIISPELKLRFFETLKQCSLVVSYGCTEALGATSRACSRPDNDPAVVDVGRTAPLMEVFVLDSRLRLSPIGVPGEVYVGGELATGYLNSPGETAARFVAHFLSRPGGARLFRTGDVGRWLSDGTLEILGRRDRQVKIRGYRVELGEIEAVLGQCRGVKQAAVLLREDAPGERRIAAYVVGTPGHRVTAHELRNDLKEWLPEYMIPTWIVVLPQLPLTTNGKLDRSALPPPRASESLARAYEPPLGDLEITLAEVWSDVLSVDRVGRNDDFFELGGHSLLAMRLIARIRQEFPVDVAVMDVLARPVFADLARYLEASTI
jgi:amino acid adenylation domain-containing protein